MTMKGVRMVVRLHVLRKIVRVHVCVGGLANDVGVLLTLEGGGVVLVFLPVILTVGLLPFLTRVHFVAPSLVRTLDLLFLFILFV